MTAPDAVPWLFDQGWNARRIQELGLGRRATTPRAIHDALATIITDAAYTQRAAVMADRIRESDGTQALTDATLNVLASV